MKNMNETSKNGTSLNYSLNRFFQLRYTLIHWGAVLLRRLILPWLETVVFGGAICMFLEYKLLIHFVLYVA